MQCGRLKCVAPSAVEWDIRLSGNHRCHESKVFDPWEKMPGWSAEGVNACSFNGWSGRSVVQLLCINYAAMQMWKAEMQGIRETELIPRTMVHRAMFGNCTQWIAKKT